MSHVILIVPVFPCSCVDMPHVLMYTCSHVVCLIIHFISFSCDNNNVTEQGGLVTMLELDVSFSPIYDSPQEDESEIFIVGLLFFCR